MDYETTTTTEDINEKAVNNTPSYYNKGIEPVDYIYANYLDFFEGNVIKYITRHKEKNGAADIIKAINYCKMILRYQYGKDELYLQKLIKNVQNE